jgi:hypothetical protein
MMIVVTWAALGFAFGLLVGFVMGMIVANMRRMIR